MNIFKILCGLFRPHLKILPIFVLVSGSYVFTVFRLRYIKETGPLIGTAGLRKPAVFRAGDP
jgi:hypothetical protein